MKFIFVSVHFLVNILELLKLKCYQVELRNNPYCKNPLVASFYKVQNFSVRDWLCLDTFLFSIKIDFMITYFVGIDAFLISTMGESDFKTFLITSGLWTSLGFFKICTSFVAGVSFFSGTKNSSFSGSTGGLTAVLISSGFSLLLTFSFLLVSTSLLILSKNCSFSI